MATPRVLVVEDDDSVRMMLHEGLHRDEFEVVLVIPLPGVFYPTSLAV